MATGTHVPQCPLPSRPHSCTPDVRLVKPVMKLLFSRVEKDGGTLSIPSKGPIVGTHLESREHAFCLTLQTTLLFPTGLFSPTASWRRSKNTQVHSPSHSQVPRELLRSSEICSPEALYPERGIGALGYQAHTILMKTCGSGLHTEYSPGGTRNTHVFVIHLGCSSRWCTPSPKKADESRT